MAILVTGGCGYIGSAVTAELIAAGHDVVVLDNLSRGHKELLHPKAIFVQADIGDAAALKKLFAENKIEAIIHLAGYIQVEESMRNPEIYVENNVEKPKILVQQAIEAGVNKFIFSSSAAVYGQPDNMPIKESDAANPINTYGQSKLDFENYLLQQQNSGLMKYAALRYFNASGATEFSREEHQPETHLIPIALEAAAGERESMAIYGDDYETADGTNIRDYIHVQDIAAAHLAVLNNLDKLPQTGALSEYAFNIGDGKGFSVKEVLSQVEKTTGVKLNIKISGRRQGDPAVLIADATKLSA
ncbi:UDP-glucose 4-epimerase GalE, partial [Patescibacteria group bacterium]|nr:UDP-glucose 4-epimerase GalE [Patescibacteria group bacterium]